MLYSLHASYQWRRETTLKDKATCLSQIPQEDVQRRYVHVGDVAIQLNHLAHRVKVDAFRYGNGEKLTKVTHSSQSSSSECGIKPSSHICR
jgi:hypothetical protein